MVLLIQFANYTLALLMWLIIGRAALGVITGGRESAVQSAFDRCTLPLFALTRKVAPFVSAKWAPLATLLILGTLRVGLVLVTHPAASR